MGRLADKNILITGWLAAAPFPPQLTRLVVGERPGASEELGLRHWSVWIVPARVLPRYRSREAGAFVVRHPVARARQRDDDVVVHQFDL